jgi:peptidoglycan/xylan/chitin deacetylase (PgdA/CDA1 family)
MQNGLFVISLDFELYWGVRDKRSLEAYGDNIRGVRQVIPSLLQLFDQYGVKATFATVGFLFCKNKEELLRYKPSVLPQYSQKKCSPYENNYLDTIGNSENDDVYHYGYSLVELLQQNGNHEIASHTFSHFYCLEQASPEAFEADLLAAKAVAQKMNLEVASIVFPRNQYSDTHIALCRKHGFTSYRGNERSRVYQPRSNEEQSKFIRATRLLDSYMNLTGHHTFTIDASEPILNIPASRFLRPYSRKLRFLDPLRLKRIKNSMTHAAKKGEAFHLWWHPHNFGINLKGNLQFLEQILQHYRFLQQTYGMRSLTMQQIAEELNPKHAETTNHFIGG